MLKKSTQNILSIFIIGCITFYMYLNWKERNNSLKDVVYVRVKIKNVELGNKGGPCFFFDYFINNKLYQGNYTVENKNELLKTKKLRAFKGDYFYIKVSKTKPKYNELLINYSVIDTTLIQPKEGWEELPEKVKSNYTDQNIDFFSGT